MGNNKHAEEAFLIATNINPYDADAQANLARLVAGKGDWRQAAFHFGKSISCDPDQPNTRYSYAAVRAQLHQFDEARRQAVVAIDLNPSMPQAHEESITEFRKALRIDPTFGPSHLNLALLKGDRTVALEQLHAAASAPQAEAAAQAPRDRTQTQYPLDGSNCSMRCTD